MDLNLKIQVAHTLALIFRSLAGIAFAVLAVYVGLCAVKGK
jgi:hypothetical protein